MSQIEIDEVREVGDRYVAVDAVASGLEGERRAWRRGSFRRPVRVARRPRLSLAPGVPDDHRGDRLDPGGLMARAAAARAGVHRARVGDPPAARGLGGGGDVRHARDRRRVNARRDRARFHAGAKPPGQLARRRG